MATFSPDTLFDQGAIYDARYGAGYNGTGSPVNVLSAERAAMGDAVRRFHANNGADELISMLDFGCGVVRVPGDLLSMWFGPGDLSVIGYDRSRVGLLRAMDSMRHHLPNVAFYEKTDRLVGICSSSRRESVKREIKFIHANPQLKPAEFAELLVEENNGNEFGIVTSWYDAVSHEQSREIRSEMFSALGSLATRTGEVIITVSTTGDIDSAMDPDMQFMELQRDDNGDRNVIYNTEIGVPNYLHLYGKGFEEYLRRTRTDVSQSLWVQPIRMKGPEYTTSIEEREAFGVLREWDIDHSEDPWTQEDYSSIHTVGGFRSPSLPPGRLAISA